MSSSETSLSSLACVKPLSLSSRSGLRTRLTASCLQCSPRSQRSTVRTLSCQTSSPSSKKSLMRLVSLRRRPAPPMTSFVSSVISKRSIIAASNRRSQSSATTKLNSKRSKMRCRLPLISFQTNTTRPLRRRC